MLLNNLTELESHICTLIEEISNIKQKLLPNLQAKENNNDTCMLLKIPKVILIGKICSYLTINQIHYLSECCCVLRRLVYGPLGWKLLSYITTPYPITYHTEIYNKNSEFNTSLQVNSDNQYSLADYQNKQFLINEKQKYIKLFKQIYETYEKTNEKDNVLAEKLQKETTHLYKLKQKYKFITLLHKKLSQRYQEHRNRLKKMSMELNFKVNQNKEDIRSYNVLIDKLQNQKQALANKVREYQKDIQIQKQKSAKYKAVLKNVKNYLNSMNFQESPQQNQDY